MKVGFVVHQFLPRFFTGTEQYTYAVARTIAARGRQAAVFTLEPAFGPGGGPVTIETADVDGLPTTRIRYWMRLHRDFFRLQHEHPLMALWFGQWLDREQPDVLHVFHLRHLGANLLDEARTRGIPTVVHLMDFWFVCPAVILTRADGSLCEGPPDGGLGCLPCVAPDLANADVDLQQAVRAIATAGRPRAGGGPAARLAAVVERPAALRARLLGADCIVSPSRFVRDVFARNGVPAERITVVPYGVDASRLQGALPPPPRPRSPMVFGFVGSLAHHKGLHVALAAFEQLDADARLEIWGRASDFEDYVTPLRERAAGDPRVAFRGPFARDRLGQVLAGIDVLVVPSLWYENTPFVVLEAFAAGVPVLATDLGGLAEIVDHGVNGERFGRGDAGALAACLARLVREPERMRRYADGIGAVPSLDGNVDALEAIYRDLIARRRPAAR